MKPFADRVIIKPDVEKTVTDSGIHLISENKTVKYELGYVVSCGDEVKELSPGDRVGFLRGAGQVIDDKGEMVRLVRLDECLFTLGEA